MLSFELAYWICVQVGSLLYPPALFSFLHADKNRTAVATPRSDRLICDAPLYCDSPPHHDAPLITMHRPSVSDSKRFEEI